MKSFFVSLFSFLALDFIWFSFVVRKFNLKMLAEIGRIQDGRFNILYMPAVGTYVLMALAVSLFVIPQLGESSLGRAFLTGACMGLIVYGVFDMTNLAILKNYPLSFALVDMAWGTFAFGAVTCLCRWAIK